MSGLSEERRKEAERHAEAHTRNGGCVCQTEYLRDLLAESAALRTERDRIKDECGSLASAAELWVKNWRKSSELRADWQARAEAAEARLAAPASPDDLARVAEIRERWDDATISAHEAVFTSQREATPGQCLRDLLWLLARLTPPTGPQER